MKKPTWPQSEQLPPIQQLNGARPHFTRTQTDKLNLTYSRRGGLDCTNSKDMTRQEFKEDADINVLLSRFGVNHQQRTLTYGEIDFNIDLQSATHAVRDAKAAHSRMSPEIQALYPTWQRFVTGIANGKVADDIARLDADKAALAAAAAKKTEHKPNVTP